MTYFSLRIGRQDERFSDRHRFSFRVSTGILHALKQSPQLFEKTLREVETVLFWWANTCILE